MAWHYPITDVREAHLRALLAEKAADWHLVVKDVLFCLQAAQDAEDERAVRFFAAKLATAYEAMGFTEKAAHYHELGTLKSC